MTTKIYYLTLFSIALIIFRLIPHPPNFSPIIASAIVAPFIINSRLYGALLPIIAMFISDLIIGLHPYQLVIYLTISIISLMAPMKKNYFKFSILAVGSSVWFFIITNFAVWMVWDFYPKTIDGLILCYTLAIPFFINTLVSTCLFTAIFLFLTKYMEVGNEKFSNIVLFFLCKMGIRP